MYFIIGLLLAFVTICPGEASAAFYKYYDEAGGVNVTNDYKSIPERYRASVITVTDKELDGRSRSRERQQRPESAGSAANQRTQKTSPQKDSTSSTPTTAEKADTPSAPADSGNSWLSRQLPFLKIAGIIGLLIAGAIIAGKFVSALAPRPLAIVIRVAIFAALTVYIFKGFSGKVVEAFNTISEESKSVQKTINKSAEELKIRVDKE